MVISIAKMLAAWLLAIVSMTLLGGLPSGRGASMRFWDGMLGIGLVMGLPMLLFALVIALPLSLFVSRAAQPVTGIILYPFLLAGVALLLSASLFPEGWKGAQQALALFAFIMGVSWSLLSLFVQSPPATI